MGPALLYEVYTNAKLGIDERRGAQKVELGSKDERKRFAEECAMFMADSHRLHVPPSEVAEVARRALGKKGDVPEHILTDLRTCSFLTIARDGSLEFVHPSFAEFFLARHIAARLKRGDASALDTRIAPEILYFIGSFADHAPSLRRRLLTLEREDRTDLTPLAQANLAAINLNTQLVAEVTWADLHPPAIRRSKVTVMKSHLLNVDLDLEGNEVGFVDCIFDGTVNTKSAPLVEFTRVAGRVAVSHGADVVSVDGGALELSLSFGVGALDVRRARVHLIPPASGHVSPTNQAVGNLESSSSGWVKVESHSAWLSSGRVHFSGTFTDSVVLPGQGAMRAGNFMRSVVVLPPEDPNPDRPSPSRVWTMCPDSLVLAASAVDVSDLVVGEGTIVGGTISNASARFHFTGLAFNPLTLFEGMRIGVRRDCIVIEGWGPEFDEIRSEFDQIIAELLVGESKDVGGVLDRFELWTNRLDEVADDAWALFAPLRACAAGP